MEGWHQDQTCLALMLTFVLPPHSVGDEMLEIDGVMVSGLDVPSACSLIADSEGAHVTLTFGRPRPSSEGFSIVYRVVLPRPGGSERQAEGQCTCPVCLRHTSGDLGSSSLRLCSISVDAVRAGVPPLERKDMPSKPQTGLGSGDIVQGGTPSYENQGTRQSKHHHQTHQQLVTKELEGANRDSSRQHPENSRQTHPLLAAKKKVSAPKLPGPSDQPRRQQANAGEVLGSLFKLLTPKKSGRQGG